MIPEDWSVPKVFRDRMGSEVGRQRIMHSADHLLIILHALPTPDDPERQGVLFWRDPDGAWASTGETSLMGHIATFGREVERLDAELDAACTALDILDLLDKLAPIRRSVTNLFDALQQAREAVGGVDKGVITARDRANAVVRGTELLDGQIRSKLDRASARRELEQAEATWHMAAAQHRLNLLVALLLPLTALGTIFGGKLTSGLEGESPWVFWVVLSAAVIGGVATVRLLRK